MKTTTIHEAASGAMHPGEYAACARCHVQQASPAELDLALAEIDGRATKAQHVIAGYTEQKRRAEARVKAQPRYASEVERLTGLIEEAKVRYAAIAAEAEPLNAEFDARGGWTRAFIVPDGHVHSSMNCSTCNNGLYATRFGWLPELSGHDEAEIVEKAGSRACTVCYPSAPVTERPSVLFHADELAKQAARDERTAKAAAKAEKAAAAALGTTIRTAYERVDTIRKAKMYLTDAVYWRGAYGEHTSYPVPTVLEVAEALALRQGTTIEAEIAAAVERERKRK